MRPFFLLLSSMTSGTMRDRLGEEVKKITTYDSL